METIVEKIHREVDQASDTLLHRSTKDINNGNVSRANRLKEVGFANSKPVVQIVGNGDKPTDLQELVLKYREKYPFYKFLTRKDLDTICEKYNLVYSYAENYIGDIPEKNANEIINSKIDRRDIDYNKYAVRIFADNDEIHTLIVYAETESAARQQAEDAVKRMSRIHVWLRRTDVALLEERRKFCIAADKSLFDLKHMGKPKVFKNPEPIDPIVFRFVTGGVLVITKWGIEANDLRLTIPELN